MSIMKITINGIQFADIDMGKNLGVVNNFLWVLRIMFCCLESLLHRNVIIKSLPH